jgi:hypothetical protein
MQCSIAQYSLLKKTIEPLILAAIFGVVPGTWAWLTGPARLECRAKLSGYASSNQHDNQQRQTILAPHTAQATIGSLVVSGI